LSKIVLIVGGYGVFGGRLASALSGHEQLRVFVAGRNEIAARRFCQDTNCEPFQVDRTSDDAEQKIQDLSPFIIIDAAGPFQNYGADPHRLIKIAIACGAHYFDLSDDAGFTSEVTKFDEAAASASLVVLSGVSSVPALSSAVVGALAHGIDDVHFIESTILPGNKAPRGKSVIRAIVSQVGQPIRLWRAGRYVERPGWGDLKAISLKNANSDTKLRRWGGIIGAPDLMLFPEHFGARNVSFRAGLDLKFMHGGLWLLTWLVRTGLMRTLLPLAGMLKMAADGLERFGSDVGAMVVTVAGSGSSRVILERRWELIVKDGDGPSIPTIAAQILCLKLIQGDIRFGARPCLEEFSLRDAEHALQRLAVKTSTEEQTVPLVFQDVLGDEFFRLPKAIRDLHTVVESRRWSGKASVLRGKGILSRIAGWIAGFPQAAEEVSVSVEMQRTARGEIWTRTFGKKRFRSYLSAQKKFGKQKLFERFGPMRFEISLALEGGELRYPVTSGRIFGLPLPRFILPESNTKEFLDQNGRASFSVEISVPIAGHVATYSGWLESRG